MMLWAAWFLVLVCGASSDGVDDKMKDLAKHIGETFTSLSEPNNHHVDWMFIVDHGGFANGELHLEYSKYLIHQLSSFLYISPMHSQAGVITYGAAAELQVPLNVQEGNQCEFNAKVKNLTLTVGKSDLNQALTQAIQELEINGRDSAKKVMVLITTAGWENVGANPYVNMAKAKNIGTLIVVVLVFDRSQSIVAPVMLSFASERTTPLQIGSQISYQSKYAFKIEARRGNLRRMYRHFLLAVEKMPYVPLQAAARHCPTCAATEACICDRNLYETYHCEEDTYEPLLSVGCPANIVVDTEPGKPNARVEWLSAKAVDFSSSLQSSEIFQAPLSTSGIASNSKVVASNDTHKVGIFSIGVTRVTQLFTDDSGNSVNCSFTVNVEDKEKPKIANCPNRTIYENATALTSTKLVYWPEVIATDNSKIKPTFDVYINAVRQLNDSFYFTIGMSAVKIIFEDQAKNFAVCNFKVAVRDFEPPVVQQCSGPNSTIYSSDTQTYVDWPEPVFLDNSRLAVRVTSDHKPGYFRIGKHTVNYQATDDVGNSVNCSFTFTVRGYPCAPLKAPINGAIICDNAVPGAICQIFCKNPYDFEKIAGVPRLSEKYSCVGNGVWFPTDHVPHCALNQGTYKKLPQTYYFDGECSDYNSSQAIKASAVEHYEGFVEGGYFKEAWGRKIGPQDFDDPICGAQAPITTPFITSPAPAASTAPTGAANVTANWAGVIG